MSEWEELERYVLPPEAREKIKKGELTYEEYVAAAKEFRRITGASTGLKVNLKYRVISKEEKEARDGGGPVQHPS